MNTLEKLFKKYKGRVIVVGVTITLVIIISITEIGRSNITKGENMIGNILTPMQETLNTASNKVSDKGYYMTNSSEIKKENELLNKEIIKLKDQIRKQEKVISSKEFLRQEYELLENTNYQLIRAEIIGKDPGNWFEKFVINKGTKDEVRKNDTIVRAVEVEKDIIVEALAGRAVDVGDDWSKVTSITDASNSVSFTISRTQESGIAKGNLKGKMTGQLFDMKSSVVKGDKVFTSGLGGVFPRDLYIGEVSKVTKKSDNLLLDVEITPAVDFNRLQDVFILRKN